MAKMAAILRCQSLPGYRRVALVDARGHGLTFGQPPTDTPQMEHKYTMKTASEGEDLKLDEYLTIYVRNLVSMREIFHVTGNCEVMG